MNLAYAKHFFALGPKVEYGPGVHEHIGGIAKEMGCHKALIVSDSNLVKAGIVDMVAAPLKAQNIAVEVFAEVDSEPTDKQVSAGVELFKKVKPDLVVGLGGGSPMDAAKCIAVMAENPGKLSDYEGAVAPFPNDKKVPLITLPTTSGTGAEIAGWAVITDTSRSYKMSLGSPYLEPQYALVDPLLTMALPKRPTAYSGLDALSQAIEGMLSRRRTPITIALGMYAVTLIAENLPRAVMHGWDQEARANMSYGSLLAGIVINTSGCIAVHCLAESMGGVYHKPHGLLVGLCLPHVLQYLLPGDYPLIAQIADALGADTAGMTDREAAQMAVLRIHELLDELDLPYLEDVGLTEADIPKIAALAVGNACLPDNPCDMDEDDFAAILQNALDDPRPLY